MDVTTVFGVLVGVCAIILGTLLEGGHLSSMLQGTAAIIVLGGTLGSVLVSHSWSNISLGWKLAREAFQKPNEDYSRKIIAQMVGLARLAKKESLLALEGEIQRISDPFAKDLVRKVIDGMDPVLLRELAEHEMNQEERGLHAAAKVWSDAGGFAPTIGIIGAVLGLIHVMGNLADTSKLGAGIAVAFVATIYGVASANLLFLPLANKIKIIIHARLLLKEMILEGALAISSGMNPPLMEQKLESFYKKLS
jgi:chemotaxis protein MotA